jgi:hypothetical protein
MKVPLFSCIQLISEAFWMQQFAIARDNRIVEQAFLGMKV